MGTHRSPIIVVIVLLGLGLSGCGSLLGTTGAPTPTPFAPPAATSTPEPSTATPTATATVTVTVEPTITPTSGPLMVSPKTGDVRCYFGPGTEYSVEGALLSGASVPALGISGDGNWIQIHHPKNERWFCWLRVADTQLSGDAATLKVIPPPVPFVESVDVTMSPATASITCGTFPYTFNVAFTILANGPTTVTFQRSLSDGHTAPPETATFLTAGTKSFSDYYRVGGKGSYWFRVHVTSPNDMTGEGDATMNCTP